MKKIIIIPFLITCSLYLQAQQTANDFDKICYCSGKETPHSVVYFDNNTQLLLLLRKGLSMNELDSLHIPYTSSQLKLLKIFNLIEQNGTKFHTVIPIFDSEETFQLREYAKQVAEKSFLALQPEFLTMAEYLKNTYKSPNGFAIIFSYVTDGLIWKEFEQAGAIKPHRVTKEILTWTGNFWMISNPRDTRYGTNSTSTNKVKISATNGVPSKFINPLFSDDESLEIVLNNIGDYGKVTDLKALKSFEMYNLFNDKGEVLVPVIYENEQDKVYQFANEISKKLCNLVLANTSTNDLMKVYDFKNPEEAIIVFYHEIMWELLALIEKNKIIERPKILINTDQAEIKDMTDLIFFVVKDNK